MDRLRPPRYLPASAVSSPAAAPSVTLHMLIQRSLQFWPFQMSLQKLVQNKKSADCTQAKRASGGVGLAPSGVGSMPLYWNFSGRHSYKDIHRPHNTSARTPVGRVWVGYYIRTVWLSATAP